MNEHREQEMNRDPKVSESVRDNEREREIERKQ